MADDLARIADVSAGFQEMGARLNRFKGEAVPNILRHAVTAAERAAGDPDVAATADYTELLARALATGEHIVLPSNGIFPIRSAMGTYSPTEPAGMIEVTTDQPVSLEFLSGSKLVFGAEEANWIGGGLTVRTIGDVDPTEDAIVRIKGAWVDMTQLASTMTGVAAFDVFNKHLILEDVYFHGGGGLPTDGSAGTPRGSGGGDTGVTFHNAPSVYIRNVGGDGMADTLIYGSGDNDRLDPERWATSISGVRAMRAGSALVLKRSLLNVRISDIDFEDMVNGVFGSPADGGLNEGGNVSVWGVRGRRIQGRPMVWHRGRGDRLASLHFEDFGRILRNPAAYTPASSPIAGLELQGCEGTRLTDAWFGAKEWNLATGSAEGKEIRGVVLKPYAGDGTVCADNQISYQAKGLYQGHLESSTSQRNQFLDFKDIGCTVPSQRGSGSAYARWADDGGNLRQQIGQTTGTADLAGARSVFEAADDIIHHFKTVDGKTLQLIVGTPTNNAKLRLYASTSLGQWLIRHPILGQDSEVAVARNLVERSFAEAAALLGYGYDDSYATNPNAQDMGPAINAVLASAAGSGAVFRLKSGGVLKIGTTIAPQAGVTLYAREETILRRQAGKGNGFVLFGAEGALGALTNYGLAGGITLDGARRDWAVSAITSNGAGTATATLPGGTAGLINGQNYNVAISDDVNDVRYRCGNPAYVAITVTGPNTVTFPISGAPPSPAVFSEAAISEVFHLVKIEDSDAATRGLVLEVNIPSYSRGGSAISLNGVRNPILNLKGGDGGSPYVHFFYGKCTGIQSSYVILDITPGLPPIPDYAGRNKKIHGGAAVKCSASTRGYSGHQWQYANVRNARECFTFPDVNGATIGQYLFEDSEQAVVLSSEQSTTSAILLAGGNINRCGDYPNGRAAVEFNAEGANNTLANTIFQDCPFGGRNKRAILGTICNVKFGGTDVAVDRITRDGATAKYWLTHNGGQAQRVLTMTGPGAGDVISVNGVNLTNGTTFATGVDAAASAFNAAAYINLHPELGVRAVAAGADLTVKARYVGSYGNAIPVGYTGASGAWAGGATTLAGGTDDGQPKHLIGIRVGARFYISGAANAAYNGWVVVTGHDDKKTWFTADAVGAPATPDTSQVIKLAKMAEYIHFQTDNVGGGRINIDAAFYRIDNGAAVQRGLYNLETTNDLITVRKSTEFYPGPAKWPQGVVNAGGGRIEGWSLDEVRLPATASVTTLDAYPTPTDGQVILIQSYGGGPEIMGRLNGAWAVLSPMRAITTTSTSSATLTVRGNARDRSYNTASTNETALTLGTDFAFDGAEFELTNDNSSIGPLNVDGGKAYVQPGSTARFKFIASTATWLFKGYWRKKWKTVPSLSAAFDKASSNSLSTAIGSARVTGGKRVKFRAVLRAEYTATAGFRVGIGGSAVVTDLGYDLVAMAMSGTGAGTPVAVARKSATSGNLDGTGFVSHVGSTSALITIEGTATIDTGGTINVQWAQQVVEASNTRLLAGSYLEIEEL